MKQIKLLLLTVAALLPSFCFAQSRAETEFPATVVVLKECPVTPESDVKGEGKEVEGESLSLIGGAFLAGLAGELVKSGLNALGAALEEASREKGFSALGTASFDYYIVQYQNVYGTNEVTLRSNLNQDASRCLVISYASNPVFDVKFSDVEDFLKEIDPDLSYQSDWKNRRIPQNPDLYVEAMLQRRADGFVVRPTLVWYRKPFPKAPKKKSGAELHATFSTPSAPSGEAAAVFALARIRLPPVEQGAVYRAKELKAYTSGVLPARPTTGSPESVRALYTSALMEYRDGEQEISKTERSLARAKIAAAKPGATDEVKNRVETLQDQLDDLKKKHDSVVVRWQNISAAGFPSMTGSTNLSARFTVIKDANKFGLAVASALKAQAKPTGDAVAAALAPQAEWTTQDTQYVAAMNAVATAQRALDIALASGDQDTIFQAQITLKNAKAAANAAAAASNRSLPFPGLI